MNWIFKFFLFVFLFSLLSVAETSAPQLCAHMHPVSCRGQELGFCSLPVAFPSSALPCPCDTTAAPGLQGFCSDLGARDFASRCRALRCQAPWERRRMKNEVDEKGKGNLGQERGNSFAVATLS